MKKLTQLSLIVFFATTSSFSPSHLSPVSKSKTESSHGCANIQLGISYNVPFFPGQAYVTVDVSWMVPQGGSIKGVLITVTGNQPIELSVSNTGQHSYYFEVPTGTQFTVIATPYSSPFPEKGKDCPPVQLSVDIPT